MQWKARKKSEMSEATDQGFLKQSEVQAATAHRAPSPPAHAPISPSSLIESRADVMLKRCCCTRKLVCAGLEELRCHGSFGPSNGTDGVLSGLKTLLPLFVRDELSHRDRERNHQ